MKLIKGNYYTFKIKHYKEPITGIFCAKSKEYIQLLYNPVDYVIDGVMYLKAATTELVDKTGDEDFTAKVMKARKFKLPIAQPKGNALFVQLLKSKKLVAIQAEKQDTMYVGYITELTDKTVVMADISTKAVKLGEIEFQFDEINTITTHSDYLLALDNYIKSTKAKK